MRQANTLLRVPAIAIACGALLAGCGGGGGSSGGTAQSIDFGYPGTRYLATAPAPLVATATSGLAVTFSSNTPSVCTVSDGKLQPVSAGECSITATQDGDSTYAPATQAQQLFKVLQHPQKITFPSPGFQALGSPPYTLMATADSGLPVTYVSKTPDICTVTGDSLTAVSSGQCDIVASQPGNVDYTAAADSENKFNVGNAPPPKLTLLTAFQSTGQTTDGGTISTGAGSNKDGWWCSDSNWCWSTVSADSLSYTYTYAIQPSDPKHPNGDNWMGAYYGFKIDAPGLPSGGISTTGNTTGGVQVGKQSTLTLGLAENADWFSTVTSGKDNADVKVTLVLGHFNTDPSSGNPCNVTVQALLVPTSASSTTYTIPLSNFNSFSTTCGLPLAATSADAAANAALEMTTYPIVRIGFDATQANTSVSGTTAGNPSATTAPYNPSYTTAITLTGPIVIQ